MNTNRNPMTRTLVGLLLLLVICSVPLASVAGTSSAAVPAAAHLPPALQGHPDDDPFAGIDLEDPENVRRMLTLFVWTVTGVAPHDTSRYDDTLMLYHQLAELDDENLAALAEYLDVDRFAAGFRQIVRSLRLRALDAAAPAADGETAGGSPTTAQLVPGHCLAPIDPVYPSGPLYDSVILGVLGLANDQTCSDDLEAGLWLTMTATDLAAEVLYTVCDSTACIIVACVAPCIAAGVLEAVAQVAAHALEACDLHDVGWSSAVARAALENAETALEALACVPAANRDGFGMGAMRGQGCNGADDDCSCDGVIDDCREDHWPPDITIDAGVSLSWYDSLGAAAAAVTAAVDARDDCQEVAVAAPVLAGACEAVVATVSATDDCGRSSSASTVVKVDASAPIVTIAPLSACHDSIEAAEAAVLAATTVLDDCTAPGDLDVRVDSTVTECGLRVRVEAIDRSGKRGVAATTVRVDTALPVVDIDALLLGFGGAPVQFDAVACYDTVAEAEAAVLAAVRASDNCTPAELLTTSVSSSGTPCSLDVTVHVRDECGNENTDSIPVRVDPDAPTVSCTVAVDDMHPRNGKMVDVGFEFTAANGCPGELAVAVDVTSDEPTSSETRGGPTPAPDAEILRGLDGVVDGVRVRAESLEGRDGRVYGLTVTATDVCGNSARAVCNVGVRNHPSVPAVDSGQHFDATGIN